MKTIIIILIFYSYAIVAFSQVLKTDEKIELLRLGGQSIEIINFAGMSDYSLAQMEQVNELKKQGVNDRNILLVMKANAKLTSDQILKLKEYQSKNYSDTIIQKSIEEKPKFTQVIENTKSIESKTEKEIPKYLIEKKQLPKDPETGKVVYEESIEVKGMKAEDIHIKAQEWMKRYLGPKELIEPLGNTEFNAKAKLRLSKTFIPHNGQWALDASVSFKVNFKCIDGQYKYTFTDFIHSYIRGSGSDYIVKPVEKMEMLLVGYMQNKINREVIKMIKDLKETIKSD